MLSRAQIAKRPVLLIEDNPEDYEATVRSLRRCGVANPLCRCEDGDAALDFLHRRGRYLDAAEAPTPGFILLDLNLPGTDGWTVLADIKRDPRLRTIPVVVFTTSSDHRDIESCYQVGANSYIQKPLDLDGFARAIARLKDYWFDTVLLPNPEMTRS
jgi:CheY-like chemotaxis protein